MCRFFCTRRPTLKYIVSYGIIGVVVDSLTCSGQRPTDGSALDDPSRRPTSYQPALVACYRPSPGGARRRDHHRVSAERHRSTEDDHSTASTINLASVHLLLNALVFVYQLMWRCTGLLGHQSAKIPESDLLLHFDWGLDVPQLGWRPFLSSHYYYTACNGEADLNETTSRTLKSMSLCAHVISFNSVQVCGSYTAKNVWRSHFFWTRCIVIPAYNMSAVRRERIAYSLLIITVIIIIIIIIMCQTVAEAITRDDYSQVQIRCRFITDD